MGASRPRRPRPQHDATYKALCGILRKLREGHELTQRDLADRLARPRSFVWKTEAAERSIDAVELVRWCRACGTDPIDVFKQLVSIMPGVIRH